MSKISNEILTGILFSLYSLPFFFSYFTGTIIDIAKNKKAILYFLLLLLLTLIFMSQLELISGAITILIILFYATSILTGFVDDVAGTIKSIWIKENINENLYKKISSINQITRRSFGLLAEALTGILLVISLRYSLLVPLALVILTTLLLLPINVSEGLAKKGIRKGFREGLNYIKRNKALQQFMILTVGNLFFNMQGILLLFYVEDVLHESAIFFSILVITTEIGIILGSTYANRIKKGKLGFYHLIFGTFIALSLMSYYIIHNFFIAIIPTFAIFFFSGINSVLTSVARLKIIDKEYMGRVGGVISIISSALSSLSGPLGGLFITIIGVRNTYLLVGIVMLTFSYLGLAFKEYYNIEV